MAILKKFRTFLVEDTSGAVTQEWTTITALLTVAAISTVGTFSVGVHTVASAIEADVTISGNGIAGGAGGLGGAANTGGSNGSLG